MKAVFTLYLFIFQEDQTILSDEHHVFLDPIQFAVIQQKSVALDEILLT